MLGQFNVRAFHCQLGRGEAPPAPETGRRYGTCPRLPRGVALPPESAPPSGRPIDHQVPKTDVMPGAPGVAGAEATTISLARFMLPGDTPSIADEMEARPG